MEAGPGAGRRRAGLRGALHGEEDQEVRRCGEEGGQESGAPAGSMSSVGSDVRNDLRSGRLNDVALPPVRHDLSKGSRPLLGPFLCENFSNRCLTLPWHPGLPGQRWAGLASGAARLNSMLPYYRPPDLSSPWVDVRHCARCRWRCPWSLEPCCRASGPIRRPCLQSCCTAPPAKFRC